jgi:hypothetical protein
MTLGIEPRGRGPAAVAVVAVVFAIVGPLVAWLHLDRLPIRVCMFKTITGIPCMTCGTTRALGRLARFDLVGAIRISPLAAVALMVMLAFGFFDLLLLPGGRTLRVRTSPGEWRWMVVLALALLFANWIYLIATGA